MVISTVTCSKHWYEKHVQHLQHCSPYKAIQLKQSWLVQGIWTGNYYHHSFYNQCPLFNCLLEGERGVEGGKGGNQVKEKAIRREMLPWSYSASTAPCKQHHQPWLSKLTKHLWVWRMCTYGYSVGQIRCVVSSPHSTNHAWFISPFYSDLHVMAFV